MGAAKTREILKKFEDNTTFIIAVKSTPKDLVEFLKFERVKSEN